MLIAENSIKKFVRKVRTNKSSKIKGSSHSVHSLEPETLSNAIGLRNKQDTPKVA